MNQNASNEISSIQTKLSAVNAPPENSRVPSPTLNHDLVMKEAFAFSEGGHLRQAEISFRQIIDAYPSSTSAYHNLAVCLIHQSRTADAELLLLEAIRLDPSYGRAHHSLGNLLSKEGQLRRALDHLRAGIQYDPTNAEAFNDLGVVLNSLKKYEEARIILEHAIRLKPRLPDAHNNLGIALTSLGKLNSARRSVRRALRLNPQFAAAHSNLGNIQKEQGDLAGAITSYEIALALEPNNASTRWNRSLALLQSGDFDRGWKEYQWRWKRPRAKLPEFSKPRWSGEDLFRRTILLHAEQGLGDTLQFIRYGSLLRAQGAFVVFLCPQPLLRLLSSFSGIDLLIAEGEGLPAFDFHAPLMDLPHILHTALTSIPNRTPYLELPDEFVHRSKQWIDTYTDPGKIRVGIAWQGNPHHAWDRFRSIPLQNWVKLGRVPWVQLISLQTGPGTEQLEEEDLLQTPLSKILRHPGIGNTTNAMLELAGLVNNLDLVITVDTATAHLAAALGIRTWIAIAAIQDWRWMQNRCDTPWYPTVRLFRQRHLLKWKSVFREMRLALGELKKTPK